MEKKVSIILVNYNGKEYNTACIDSILQTQDTCNGLIIRKQIIIVDNASTDDSVDILKEKYCIEVSVESSERIYQNRIQDVKLKGCTNTQIELILLERNYGFAAANNKGIERAEQWGADYVLLLNNDTEIDSNMIECLLNCAERNTRSVIIPKIYYSDDRNRIWSAGGSISPVVRKIRHDGLNQMDKGQFEKERKVEFATGCCLLIPRNVLAKTGKLDERFFLYYEDVEYSLRLLRLGIAIYYCPKAYMYHKVGASSKGAESSLCAYYISRNWLLCSKENLGRRYWIFLFYFTVNRVVCCLCWLIKKKPRLVNATICGVKDFRNRKFGKADFIS